MEQIKETGNQDNQLVEVGQVWYESRNGYYVDRGCATLYIRNTFGILSGLVKIGEGHFFLVIPEKPEGLRFNAYFEINGSTHYLTLPDNLISVLQKGSLS